MLSEPHPRRGMPVDTLAVISPSCGMDSSRTDYLSSRERERLRHIGHVNRKARWIAGRLLVKYLLLERHDAAAEKTCETPLRSIAATSLDRFPAWRYREIEIVPRCLRTGGHPTLTWSGESPPPYFSLAHTAGLTAACFDRTSPIGLDAEVSCARHEAFYRVNFTPRERRWANRTAESGGLDTHRLYTLLWCMKESALKSRQADGVSLWEIPRIEFVPPDQVGPIVDALGSKTLGERPAVFDAEFCDGGQCGMGLFGVTASLDVVLTVMRR